MAGVWTRISISAVAALLQPSVLSLPVFLCKDFPCCVVPFSASSPFITLERFLVHYMKCLHAAHKLLREVSIEMKQINK